MDPRTRRLAEDPVGKLLLRFSLPAVAGMLVTSLYTVIDRMFLGHAVGADAIGGLSICMPIAFVMMAVGMLIGIGRGALVSIHLGQQRKAEAEAVLGNAAALLVIASVGLSWVCYLALDPLLTAFGATARTLLHARAFLRLPKPGGRVFIGAQSPCQPRGECLLTKAEEAHHDGHSRCPGHRGKQGARL
jgi:Na+-driven multidrug efflux pump